MKQKNVWALLLILALLLFAGCAAGRAERVECGFAEPSAPKQTGGQDPFPSADEGEIVQ